MSRGLGLEIWAQRDPPMNATPAPARKPMHQNDNASRATDGQLVAAEWLRQRRKLVLPDVLNGGLSPHPKTIVVDRVALSAAGSVVAGRRRFQVLLRPTLSEKIHPNGLSPNREWCSQKRHFSVERRIRTAGEQ